MDEQTISVREILKVFWFSMTMYISNDAVDIIASKMVDLCHFNSSNLIGRNRSWIRWQKWLAKSGVFGNDNFASRAAIVHAIEQKVDELARECSEKGVWSFIAGMHTGTHRLCGQCVKRVMDGKEPELDPTELTRAKGIAFTAVLRSTPIRGLVARFQAVSIDR